MHGIIEKLPKNDLDQTVMEELGEVKCKFAEIIYRKRGYPLSSRSYGYSLTVKKQTELCACVFHDLDIALHGRAT